MKQAVARSLLVSGTGTRTKSFCKLGKILLIGSIQHHAIRLQSTTTASKSYIHKCGTSPLVCDTIGQIVDKVSDKYGDREAVVDCGQSIRKTFTEYKRDIDKLALGLLALGLQRGDRIAIWSPNRYEWAVVQFASAKAGLIMVTINPAYQASEMEYCLEKLHIRAMVAAESFRTQDYYKLVCTIMPEITELKPEQKVKSHKHPYFDTLIMISDKSYPGGFRFSDVMTAGGRDENVRLQKLQREILFDDAVNIQFTSGTTGRPKAAVLSHHNIMNNAEVVNANLGYYSKAHRICCNVPLFHCFGCVATTSVGIASGTCTVFPAPSFSPEAALKCIQQERCTSIYGTPTMYFDILNHPLLPNTNLSHVEVGIMAGASCPPHLVAQVAEKLNCAGLVVAYGSTELSPLISIHHHTDLMDIKMHNVGKIVEHIEVKAVDMDGSLVPMGSPGEICARGYLVMQGGYWDDEAQTREAIKNGWYHTGDLGILTDDGYCKIIGRIKDMIIRGGENIYPREIENVLIKHPKIFDAHVIGVPDERLGEQVCVWIKLKDNESMTEKEVKEYCTGQISRFKIPHYIRFVNGFPKTVSGKVQKYKMREEMAKLIQSEK